MKLSRFEIRWFKGLSHIVLDWDDILVLIGENNSGKSSVLQALDWFLGGRKISDTSFFCDRCCDEEHAIELIGHFSDLDDTERAATAVQGRMCDGKWILKKEFWQDDEDKFQERYYSYSEQEVFADWPDNESAWQNWPDEYQELIGEIGGGRVTNAGKNQLREFVRQRCPDLITVNQAWIPNPGGGGSWKSNANSILPRFISVRAVHDASAETQSKDATSFGKIVNLIVEWKLMRRKELQELKEKLEVVLNLFRTDPEHPELRAQEIRDTEETINLLLEKLMPARASIETGDPPDIAPLLLPNTILKLSDGFQTNIEHQGHGLQRALIVTLLQVLVDLEDETPENEQQEDHIRSTILAVEEPELYLHPQMERKMRDVLYDLATSDSYQVICTTHSPVFLNMADKHRAIVRLEKDWSTRQVTKHQVTTEVYTGDTASDRKKYLRMVLDFDPSANELFFAKRVVLVEGDTEMAVLPEAAKLLGIFDKYPHLKHDVTFVNCHGKWTIPAFQEMLNHFQIEYFVLHDQDSQDSPAFGANEVIVNLLPSPESRYMFVDNIEQALGMDLIPRKDKPIRALEHVHALGTRDGGFPEEFAEAVQLVYLGPNASESSLASPRRQNAIFAEG